MVAKGNEERPTRRSTKSPRYIRSSFAGTIEEVDWETCYQVLEEGGQLGELRKSWK